ncbi:molybdenum ABC transporter ATP-binding protein [Defluviimonas sp. WL0002]|uniref:Molybdenum ABC transporter ATP-binding protein n=1 Tax=Albidovulum marisflavi TaxID=2984159 RepID=A0ABT2ZF02_9RHOB|nr:molybdenum ABC transporter ATP-binding protein [Defluviimonas sp. WL0002]MCV2869665.1 molybdenum ABC transporter ATP-binding protein [Defluviimonas sp. WL0002]
MTGLDLDIRHSRGDFSLAVQAALPASGLTAVFGPSGAGKSTLLRLVAGFERAEGRIAFGDQVWSDQGHFVPPHRRRVATVFQEPRLFAHLDVRGNLSYAARRSGAEIAPVVRDLGLEPLLPRRTGGLSGGEAQRVALARALLTRPRLILMDEPLSALDQARRAEILPLVEGLRDRLGLPILYVSHSVGEVARLATHVLAMVQGHVASLGPAEDVFANSAAAVAFGGEEPGSLIAARVIGMTDDGLCRLGFAGGEILLPEPVGPKDAKVRVFVRARDVMIAAARPEGLSALNILPAVVHAVGQVNAASSDVILDMNGSRVRARVTHRSVRNLELSPGRACHAILKSVALARD